MMSSSTSAGGGDLIRVIKQSNDVFASVIRPLMSLMPTWVSLKTPLAILHLQVLFDESVSGANVIPFVFSPVGIERGF